MGSNSTIDRVNGFRSIPSAYSDEDTVAPLA